MAIPEYSIPDARFRGLSEAEVKASRETWGRNLLTYHEGRAWAILKGVLLDPMMILLMIACSIYFFTGKPNEGVIMAVALAFIAAISIYQSFRTERAMKVLSKLSQPYSRVIRDGRKISIPSEELVKGDLMIVSEGEQVTADAEIVEYNDISVDESLLTGESVPVAKDMLANKLFCGTTVTSGLAHARVTATGNNTRLGQLGISMERTKRGKTPLEEQVGVFVRRMALLGLSTFAVVAIINAIKTNSWVTGLLEGLTLAMALIPEEIPVAFTTFMSLGAYRMIKIKVLVKQPQTVEALGAATVICADKTGTITENRMKVQELYDVRRWQQADMQTNRREAEEIMLYARLASEPIPFDPMEKAIIQSFDDMKLSAGNYKLVKEYPLAGHPPFMTHVYSDTEGRRIITCKGAPEGIIRNSLLTEEQKQKVRAIQEEMAGKGNRVLAIAVSDFALPELPSSQEEFKWRLLGLLALSDPPKKNIAEVIRQFYTAGIKVKMITGDYPQTAMGIAKQIGMEKPERCISGEEISSMDDKKLAGIVDDFNIFARVQPEIKLKIINAMRANGEVVAMTGDGVNDGPALKAAHIGIAMGERGSEVARQAASIVLVNEDLKSMADAVALGRKIYSNLKKAIQYIITIHVPILSFVVVPLLLNWQYPSLFKPVHIIFLELIMGPTCSIVYENEPMEEA